MYRTRAINLSIKNLYYFVIFNATDINFANRVERSISIV